MEQAGVAAGDGATRPEQRIAVGNELLEPEPLTQCVGRLASGTRLGSVEQKGAGQRDNGLTRGPVLTAFGHGFEGQIEPGEQPAQRQIVVDRSVSQSLHRQFGDPPQAPKVIAAEPNVQLPAHALHGTEQRILRLLLQPGQ